MVGLGFTKPISSNLRDKTTEPVLSMAEGNTKFMMMYQRKPTFPA